VLTSDGPIAPAPRAVRFPGCRQAGLAPSVTRGPDRGADRDVKRRWVLGPERENGELFRPLAIRLMAKYNWHRLGFSTKNGLFPPKGSGPPLTSHGFVIQRGFRRHHHSRRVENIAASRNFEDC